MATYNLATWILPGTNTLLNPVNATVDTAGNMVLGGTIIATNLPAGTPLLRANNLNDVASKPSSLSNLGALPIAGGTMTGNLILNGNPSTNLQAVTKQYADNLTAGVDYKTATQFGTTAAIVGTYLNGASGVGATITYTATGAISIDGNTPSVGDRILVKNQASTFQNGIYNVTVVGTTGVSGVLTRSSDYDDSIASEIGLNDLVPIIGGTVNAGAIWRQTNPGPFTIGTTPITFVIYSVGTYTSGAGISIAGNVISVPNAGISYARIQNETNATLLGNPTGSPAAPSEITLGSGLSFSGTTLVSTGTGGTVTTFSFTNANGVTGVVTNPTTTPNLTVSLNAITPTSVNGVVLSGSSTPTLAVTGTTAVSGTNTGDQTITLTGDVTGSGTGSFAATIAANAVTLAKLATQAANTFLANGTAGTAVPTAIALSTRQLAGRGSSGNISAIGIDLTTLNISGTTLAVVAAPALNSATTTVNVSSATAPSSGQVLTATSSTAATWQAPAALNNFNINAVATVTGTTQALAVGNLYYANNASLVTLTIPSTFAVGEVIAVMGQGAGGWKIAQNASQNIIFGDQVSTTGTGGSWSSSQQYDNIFLVGMVANTTMAVRSAIGNPTPV